MDVGKEPHHLYPTADGKFLIVANAASDDLHYLDPLTGQIQKRVRSIGDPYQIGFSPDQKWFVAAALRLIRVDLHSNVGGESKIVKRIPISRAPSHIWFSADSRFVFVTLQESDEVAAIDLTTEAIAWRVRARRLIEPLRGEVQWGRLRRCEPGSIAPAIDPEPRLAFAPIASRLSLRHL